MELNGPFGFFSPIVVLLVLIVAISITAPETPTLFWFVLGALTGIASLSVAGDWFYAKMDEFFDDDR